MLESAEQGVEPLQGYMALSKELCDVVGYGLSLGFREPHGSICSIQHETKDLHFDVEPCITFLQFLPRYWVFAAKSALSSPAEER
jgi:hypothetical protein